MKIQYKDVCANPFLCKDLEDVFLSLDEVAIDDIIGVIPNPDNVEVEYGVMKDVVDYMLKVKTNPQKK
ncbi:hypothetical protein DWZ57_20730 [Bacteroides fragilis]|nr:hypothetical protein DWZ57_20730 [Bacteroides fragilis]